MANDIETTSTPDAAPAAKTGENRRRRRPSNRNRSGGENPNRQPSENGEGKPALV